MLECQNCGVRISAEAVRSEAARMNQAKAKRHGPLPKLRPCPKCGRTVSARDQRRKCPHDKPPTE